ncbi:hypothetical protein C8J57DRAFT_1522100 [Mycena rebaudengoi]|nr:hypothetical protein C8J57DRAFT_1522100 [Mycena rebaudengoi]
MRFTFTSAFLASLALFCAVRGGNAAPVQENQAIGLRGDEEYDRRQSVGGYNGWGPRDGGVGMGESYRRQSVGGYNGWGP